MVSGPASDRDADPTRSGWRDAVRTWNPWSSRCRTIRCPRKPVPPKTVMSPRWPAALCVMSSAMAASRHAPPARFEHSPQGGAVAPQHAPTSLLVNEQPGTPEGWISSVKLIIVPMPSRRAVPGVVPQGFRFPLSCLSVGTGPHDELDHVPRPSSDMAFSSEPVKELPKSMLHRSSRHSRASGNLGISVACPLFLARGKPGPRFSRGRRVGGRMAFVHTLSV